jgi:hypothetical protein
LFSSFTYFICTYAQEFRRTQSHFIATSFAFNFQITRS